MMFQDFALFPQRNVADNIAFGLEMKKQKKAVINRRVAQMLELVNLEGYGHRRVDELSGGERQRVALARTLAPSPDLVMLDEPLGSLDRLLRERLLADLCHILSQTGVTTIFVTHDQNEAFAAADRICILIQGQVQQIDTPEQLYNHPENLGVADFLGFQNLIDGKIDPIHGCFSTGQGRFVPNALLPEGNACDLLILPWAARPIAEHKWLNLTENRLSGRVLDLFFQGSMTRLVVKTADNQTFAFDIPSIKQLPRPGEAVFVEIHPDGLRFVGKE
jgi:ABC-type Fe3+/spermidine/putrescine transport system ATPase subunit